MARENLMDKRRLNDFEKRLDAANLVCFVGNYRGNWTEVN